MKKKKLHAKLALYDEAVIRAWAGLPVPDRKAVLTPMVCFEEGDNAQIFCGRRFDEVDIDSNEFARTSALDWMDDVPALYYYGSYLLAMSCEMRAEEGFLRGEINSWVGIRNFERFWNMDLSEKIRGAMCVVADLLEYLRNQGDNFPDTTKDALELAQRIVAQKGAGLFTKEKEKGRKGERVRRG